MIVLQHPTSIFFRDLVPRRWRRQASIISVVIQFDTFTALSYSILLTIEQQLILHTTPFQWTNLIGWAILLTLWTASAYGVFKILQDPSSTPKSPAAVDRPASR